MMTILRFINDMKRTRNLKYYFFILISLMFFQTHAQETGGFRSG